MRNLVLKALGWVAAGGLFALGLFGVTYLLGLIMLPEPSSMSSIALEQAEERLGTSCVQVKSELEGFVVKELDPFIAAGRQGRDEVVASSRDGLIARLEHHGDRALECYLLEDIGGEHYEDFPTGLEPYVTTFDTIRIAITHWGARPASGDCANQDAGLSTDTFDMIAEKRAELPLD